MVCRQLARLPSHSEDVRRERAYAFSDGTIGGAGGVGGGEFTPFAALNGLEGGANLSGDGGGSGC